MFRIPAHRHMLFNRLSLATIMISHHDMIQAVEDRKASFFTCSRLHHIQEDCTLDPSINKTSAMSQISTGLVFNRQQTQQYSIVTRQ